MGSLTPILQMSVTGSFLFIITCIFKPFTNKNFSATWNYYMLVLTYIIHPLIQKRQIPLFY